MEKDLAASALTRLRIDTTINKIRNGLGFFGVLSRHSKVIQLGFGSGYGKRAFLFLFLCVYKTYDVRERWVGVTFFLPNLEASSA